MSWFSRHKEPSLTIHVLLYKEDDEWVGHCLEMDLVTCGSSSNEVEKDIIDLIVSHVNFAVENDNLKNVFKPAPDKYWAMLADATRCSHRKIPDGKHTHLGNVELCAVG